ncbi:MAG TPA: DUF3299 domain-containing protein [Casimicrobiaceae bacterium]|jgi:hypothetical protein|nr:DUF3299 domain-containing protein [Casimicrobiaceae bacterium]
MTIRFASFIGAAILAAALPVRAIDTGIPPTGLPSAADYASQLLPEINGVVSWKTLSQVEPVKQGGKMVPQFSRDIMGLDKKDVRVQGFIIPLDMGDKQKHFLLSAVPPHCPFCMPAGPDTIVEVLAKKPLAYGFEPIVVAGRFAVLKDDPAGVLYRMTDAELVAAPSR